MTCVVVFLATLVNSYATDLYGPFTDGSQKVLREVWTGVPGGKLSDLDYTSTPNLIEYITSFDAPTNWGDSYGSRLTAYVEIPSSGTYTFYTASDDQSELRLSLTGDVTGLVPVANVPVWTAHKQWGRKYQSSENYYLTAGQTILLQVIHKDAGGADHLAVGWAIDGAPIDVIPVQHCTAPTDNVAILPPTTVNPWHVADSLVRLAWDASNSFFVNGYNIYRNGVLVFPNVQKTSFVDTTVTPETTYSYAVSTRDFNGNESILTQNVTVTTSATPAVGEGTGLTGLYYSGNNFENRVLVREDPIVNFDWQEAAPAPEVPNDNFSARWLGTVQPQYSGDWTFYTQSDDGVRLWINDTLLINNWGLHGSTENQGSLSLEAGKRYSVRLEFFENDRNAVLQLRWSHFSKEKEVIPQSQLYPCPWAEGTAIAITTAAGSYTSPAFVEGNIGADTAEVTLSGAQATINRYRPMNYYANVTLDATKATSIEISTGDNTARQELNWLPTLINGSDLSTNQIVIRKGDSLLLTALDAKTESNIAKMEQYIEKEKKVRSAKAIAKAKATMGKQMRRRKTVRIDADGDGVMDFHCGSRKANPFKYDEVGVYAVTATARNKPAGELTVIVVDVNFNGPIASEIGYTRTKDVTILGGTAADVTFTSANPWLLTTTVIVETETGATLGLLPLLSGTPMCFARLGENGPVIATQEIDEFTLTSSASKSVIVVEEYEDGSKLVQATLQMTPLIENLDVKLHIFAGGITFEDSTVDFDVSSNEFEIIDGVPSYTYSMIWLAGKPDSGKACHTATVEQDGNSAANTKPNFNPKQCTPTCEGPRVDKIVFPEGPLVESGKIKTMVPEGVYDLPRPTSVRATARLDDCVYSKTISYTATTKWSPLTVTVGSETPAEATLTITLSPPANYQPCPKVLSFTYNYTIKESKAE